MVMLHWDPRIAALGIGDRNAPGLRDLQVALCAGDPFQKVVLQGERTTWMVAKSASRTTKETLE